jgi:hypothetical protein
VWIRVIAELLSVRGGSGLDEVEEGVRDHVVALDVRMGARGHMEASLSGLLTASVSRRT